MFTDRTQPTTVNSKCVYLSSHKVGRDLILRRAQSCHTLLLKQKIYSSASYINFAQEVVSTYKACIRKIFRSGLQNKKGGSTSSRHLQFCRALSAQVDILMSFIFIRMIKPRCCGQCVYDVLIVPWAD